MLVEDTQSNAPLRALCGGKYFGHRPHVAHLSIIQYQDIHANVGEVPEEVTGDHCGDLHLTELTKDFADLQPAPPIKPQERVIQQKHRGVVDERSGEREPSRSPP